jgi:hypothetical protein
MLENFASRYKTICLQPTPEQLMNRFKGIQDICNEQEFDVASLVRLFYDLPVDVNFKNKFSDYFFNKDITFDKGNLREIAFLAGETLLEMLEHDYYTNLIVLLITCIWLFKNNTLIPEISSIALNKLDEVCLKTREDAGNNVENIKETNLTEMEKAVQGQPVTADTIQKIINILKIVNVNIKNIYINQKQICKSVDVYKEESNILSWLMGQWSNDLKKQLNNKTNQSKIALILGKELADLVLTIPGPYSAKAILKRMIDLCKADCKTLSLVDMVDMLDTKWKGSLLDKYHLSASDCNTPILLAIAKSLEVDGPRAWGNAYGKIMGFDAETVVQDMLTWGYQMYLECMLVKCLSEE